MSISTTLNLVASENLQSAVTRICHLSRWSEVYYLANKRYERLSDSPYPVDPRWPDILEAGNLQLRRLFGAEWADPRPLSGTHAMNCLLAGVCRAGDTVVACPEDIGGHFATYHMAGRLGLRVEPMCYDPDAMALDPVACARLIESLQPALVTFDVSHQLFRHPLAEIRRCVSDSIVFAFDASHTLGLVAGGVFQRPLQEGADILHGGAHKSFPGPQKGLFLGNDPSLQARIDEAVFPQFSSNYHLHHVLALFATSLEMEYFGAAYASQTIANARALGAALDRLGLGVFGARQGYTETHQVWLRVPAERNVLLQACGIRATTFPIPGSSRQEHGVRLGVQYLTRAGMKAADMEAVARCIHDALASHADTGAVRRRVAELASSFDSVHYAFENEDQLQRAGELGLMLHHALREEGLLDMFAGLAAPMRSGLHNRSHAEAFA